MSLLTPEDVAECRAGEGDPRKVFALAVSGLRKAFFEDLVDVSACGEQLALAERLGLPVALLEANVWELLRQPAEESSWC